MKFRYDDDDNPLISNILAIISLWNQACQLADSDDADATIGIGLAGQETTVEMGAGWTELFATGKDQCGGKSKRFKSILVSVRKV